MTTVTFVKCNGREFSDYFCTVGGFHFIYSLESFLSLEGLLKKSGKRRIYAYIHLKEVLGKQVKITVSVATTINSKNYIYLFIF